MWVDADACPKVVKEILFRAAKRTGVALVLVANHPVSVPRSPGIRSVQVQAGLDVADGYIAARAAAGDLVITADIPLAADVVGNGCTALNPRGTLYTEDNIREALNLRDFMDTLRGAGVQTGGPPALSQADRQRFAQELDRWLAVAGRRSDTR
ncbi:MAG: YaiI/YqxD family protein [Pseudomonadota bacterium]